MQVLHLAHICCLAHYILTAVVHGDMYHHL